MTPIPLMRKSEPTAMIQRRNWLILVTMTTKDRMFDKIKKFSVMCVGVCVDCGRM